MIFTTKPPFSFSHVFRISILAFVLICGIALPTHFFAQENVKVLSDGKILINTNNLIGASDLTLRSTNPTFWGGMYVESPDGANGRPFYGYAVNGLGSVYHYWDKGSNSWRLNYSGDRLILNSEGRLGIGTKILLHPTGFGNAASLEMIDDDGTRTVWIRANESTGEGADIRLHNESGALSVDIDGDFAANGSGAMDLYDEDGTKTVQLRAAEVSGQGAELKMYDMLGNLSIEIDADFEGNGRVITDELEIKGGSDLAEYFDSKDKSITPGSVVCIDPDNPGMVLPAGAAYDKKVVGVVSGANGIKPGMMMGQQGSIAFGDVPVAIAGRVYVRVDESNGPVEPGDFLTTADDGKAMRVTDWDAARGAIVGKALTRADENGFVLSLIHLQ